VIVTTKANTRQYDVVVGDDETLRSVMDELTMDLIVTWDMVTEYGPAGHPVVQVTGTDNAMVIFEGRYNGDAGIV
jgi:hypothetical protein